MSSGEDSEIFEITDFTTATDFERFVARIEELVHEWKLTAQPPDVYSQQGFDINKAEWIETKEEIAYIDFPFTVTHHYVKPYQHAGDHPSTETQTGSKDRRFTPLLELQSTHQDFPEKAHCLCRWFGLTSFLVITPKSYSISNQSRIQTVMSAINIAIQNSLCTVPVFLQCLELRRKFYLGRYGSEGCGTEFSMVHLRNVPPQYRNLTGLLEVFKSKMNVREDPMPPVNVSIRFTYILQDWEEYMFDWPQAPPDMSDTVESPAIGVTEIHRLPFGACQDPVVDLYLFTTWHNISEEVVTESEIYSDLDPLQAPQWTVRVNMAASPQCLLADCLLKFMNLCSRSETFQQVLGRPPDQTSDEEHAQISGALERLTQPQAAYSLPNLSKVKKVVTDTKLRLSSPLQEDSPIPIQVLNKILVFLFPDAKSDEQQETDESKVDPVPQTIQDNFRSCKAAPVNSVVYKLATTCCTVNYSFGGLKAVAHLWHEFVLEMRYRWENSLLIPGLEKGSPNLGQGILYQKLQMLNCCIEKKLHREQDSRSQKKTPLPSVSSANSEIQIADPVTADPVTSEDTTTPPDRPISVASGSDSDEFFDTEEAVDNDSAIPVADEAAASADTIEGDVAHSTLYEESVQYQPQGRLSKLDDLRLLRVDEALYIPVTQEPAPMTEDQLEAHAEVLTRLGTSAEGANLRAKMQSASLVSDMESFKAANPGCVLEDFVRWYSPRDYVIEMIIDSETGFTVEKGQLSERMLVPGNMWQEVWESARPVPARRQKRLFNDTKEAEKVLHYLSALTPSQLTLHLLPMVCQEAVLVLRTEGERTLPSVSLGLKALATKLESLSRSRSQNVALYTDTVGQISKMETAIARARSLYLKFACDGSNKDNKEVMDFVGDLMNQPEVKVLGAARGPVGQILSKMFSDAKSMLDDDNDGQAADREAPSDSGDSYFPTPSAREYILRTTVPCPAPYSQRLPQRMYCTLLDQPNTEYRLAGAFSIDTTFQ